VSRRRRAAVIGGPVLLCVVAVAAAAIGTGRLGGSPAAGTTTAPPPPAIATVTRTTLTQTEQVNGTLGYGTAHQVRPDGSGTITWLPAVRMMIGRGQPVYKMDNHSIPLFYGGLPFYRQLSYGDTGADVTELERNLAALGYTGFTVDDEYTAATASAVSAWQHDLGVTQTGTFDPGSVVLAPGQVRVASLDAQLGDHASGPVLSWTGTTRTVQINLDASLQQLVKRGTTATVRLPSGATLHGTVTGIGSVITAQGNQPATIGVTLAVREQSALGTLDQAPVTVNLISATARNVLTVPVAALVALAEGGYGVQVVTGSSTHYVPVRLGMFANGRVEISGPGLSAGTRVGVASS
jgi:peptidoglycan hydrolase-like protein with peptidoglycan-binding domain